MKRKREELREGLREAEAESKSRRISEFLDTIAYAFGPSQDIFLHLFLLDPTHASAIALSRVSRAWNVAYKQTVDTHVTLPLNRYLCEVIPAYDAFAHMVAQPNALRLGMTYSLNCSPRTPLARFLLPPLHGKNQLVYNWLGVLPRTDGVRLCGHILVDNNTLDIPAVLTEIFPGFRRRQDPDYLRSVYGSPVQYLDSTASHQRPRVIITLRTIDDAHWRAYIRSSDMTYPFVDIN